MKEIPIIIVVLSIAVSIWLVLGIFFFRHIRRDKTVQRTIGGVPVTWGNHRNANNDPEAPSAVEKPEPATALPQNEPISAAPTEPTGVADNQSWEDVEDIDGGEIRQARAPRNGPTPGERRASIGNTRPSTRHDRPNRSPASILNPEPAHIPYSSRSPTFPSPPRHVNNLSTSEFAIPQSVPPPPRYEDAVS